MAMLFDVNKQAEIDALIALPKDVLRLADGRTIQVRRWTPSVAVNDVVAVVVEGYLCQPELEQCQSDSAT